MNCMEAYHPAVASVLFRTDPGPTPLYLCFLPTSLTTVHILNIQRIKFIFYFTSPSYHWRLAARILTLLEWCFANFHRSGFTLQLHAPMLESLPVFPSLVPSPFSASSFFDYLQYVLHTACKRWKTGGGEGLGTRLSFPYSSVSGLC